MATIDTIANEVYQRHLLKGVQVAPAEKEVNQEGLMKRPQVEQEPEQDAVIAKNVVLNFIDALSNDVYDSNIVDTAVREPSTDVQMGSDKMYGMYKTPVHVFQAMNRDVDPDTAEIYVRETPQLDYLNRLDIDTRESERELQEYRRMVAGDTEFAFPTAARQVSSRIKIPKLEVSEEPDVTIKDAPDEDIVLDDPTPTRTEGLGSRPVAEAQTAPISGGEIREPDFEPPKEEVKEVLFIQKGLTDLGFKPGGVDGAVGGGTRRALRKFQKANGLEITGIMTPEVFTLIRSGEAVKYPDPPKPDAKVSKILDSNFEVFKEAVAQKESSGRYNIMGGYNNHYVGRYQMGKDALEDEGYSYKKRDALLKDPKKQDELFKKFTLRNHKKLTQNSKKYRDMSEKEKLGVLGYAHNQGATAAEEWLYTGVSGKDANGTLGDEYTSLISRYFSLASKRPRARPDTLVASN